MDFLKPNAEAPAQGGDAIRLSTRDVLGVFFRHMRGMALFFVAVVAAMVVYTLLTPDSYESEAKIFLRLGREDLSVDPTVTEPTLGVPGNRESAARAELAILTSRFLAERVVDAVGERRLLASGREPGPGADLDDAGRGLSASGVSEVSPRDKAVRVLMSSLGVRSDLDTDIIQLTYRAPSAQLAHDALDAVIDAYLERHIEIYSTQASPGFFKRQADQLASELASAQQALHGFREENGIASFELQRENLLGQINDLEVQLYETSSSAAASRVRIASLSRTLQGNAETLELDRTPGSSNDAAESLKQRLVDLQLKESSLASRYQDDHRPLLEVREQMRHIEQVLSRAQQLALEKERAQLEAHEARGKFIARELNERRNDLAELALSKERLERLELDKELAEAEFRQYRENLQRARIATALDLDKVSNLSVIQPATFPKAPISPDRRLNLILALVAGTVGALLFALFSEYASDTMKTKDDVESLLGVPVIASISEREFKDCVAGSHRTPFLLGGS